MIAALIIALMVTDAGYSPQPIEPVIPIEAQEVLKVVSEPQEIHLYGNCRITFYCPNSCCCGQWAGGGTASGVRARSNHTVANGSLPFGTRLLIDGQEYVVEDRGVGAFEIDIFVDSHEEALRRGLYYRDVYIIDG